VAAAAREARLAEIRVGEKLAKSDAANHSRGGFVDLLLRGPSYKSTAGDEEQHDSREESGEENEVCAPRCHILEDLLQTLVFLSYF